MTPGRIAAVLTCHNLGRWLPEALASLERQTRPAAEIILVDDGSTDTYTRQVVNRLERSGTRVVQAGGRGVAVARNCGARLTSSEYLMWLDADDVLEPDYFEVAGAALDSQPDLDFVSSAVRAFGAASYLWTPPAPTFVEAISVGGWPHASTMLRRPVWETVGGFDEALRLFELLDFWASVMERGFRGLILEKAFLNYRVRPGSGYRRMIQPGTYLSRMAHFYAKHRAAVESNGFDLIQGKEAFLLGQREHRRMLESQVASLEAEHTQLRAAIDEISRRLEERGSSRVNWGDLKRVRPLSQQGGKDRGTPVDRHYVESFLNRHRADVSGRVLEFGGGSSAQRLDGDDVTARDVLEPTDTIPAGTYDCIILTDPVRFVDDLGGALAECERILRPGGVLLAAAPSVSGVGQEPGRDGDFWRLTEASARKFFADVFPLDAFDVTVYGNVMACTAFLYGVSAEEMTPADLGHVDSASPLLIAIRAVKPAAQPAFTTIDVSQAGHAAVILAYHRVAELNPDSHALCTPPAEFREHMTYLRRYFSPIGLEDLVRAAAAGRIPERAVVVTLDDGYLDALTVASPILTELNVPATFFVNTDRLHEEHERWWDILERIFVSEPALPPILALKVGGQDLRLPTATAGERHHALELLNRTAWPLDALRREELVGDVLVWSGAARLPRASHRVLTGDEIRTLARRPGHSIGAHTTHHLALTTQPEKTTRREVFENKATLEELIRRPVHLFAYPYGEFDPQVIAAVGEAGFHAGVTVHAGLVSAGTNRLLLPRHEVTPGHPGGFLCRMREIFDAPHLLV